MKKSFIVIDDNYLSCYIAEKYLKSQGITQDIHQFLEAKKALEFIESNHASLEKAVIMLDLQMPEMSGFRFIEKFEQLPEAVRAKFDLYILTSSINEKDLVKASTYPSVRKFYSKPLNGTIVQEMLNGG